MLTVKKKKKGVPAVFISVGVFVVIAVFVLIMLKNAEENSREEALKATEDSIIRAAVSAYAYEGVYPENIEYLEENYNLIINWDRYHVIYSTIGDNIMPSVIVTERTRRDTYEME